MNKHKFTNIFLTFLLALLSISLPNGSLAVASTSDYEPVAIKDVNEKNNDKCEIIKEKREGKIQLFKDNKQKHINLYQNIEAKLTNHINLLKNKGYDVEKLQNDTEEFSSMVKDYESKYNALVEELNKVSNYQCDNTDKRKLMKIFKDSRTELDTVQKKRSEIGSFYKNVIKQDIKELHQVRVEEATDSSK